MSPKKDVGEQGSCNERVRYGHKRDISLDAISNDVFGLIRIAFALLITSSGLTLRGRSCPPSVCIRHSFQRMKSFHFTLFNYVDTMNSGGHVSFEIEQSLPAEFDNRDLNSLIH